MFKKAKQALLAALGSKKFVQARRVLIAGRPYVDEQGDRICHMCVQGVMAHIVQLIEPARPDAAFVKGKDGQMYSGNFHGEMRTTLAQTYGVNVSDLHDLMRTNDNASLTLGWEPLTEIIQNADELPDPETPIATSVTA